MNSDTVIVRHLGLQEYQTCWQAMQNLTHQRNEFTLDEIWLLEHSPVFTQGQNGKPEHVLNPGNIPVINIDRGGQVTYHGPGQLIAYTLIDLKRKKWTVRQLVSLLEESIIQLLAEYKIHALAKSNAPGVYVENEKICSLGLRIRRGCSYHGLALNVAMDLSPFSRINPCGHTDLRMTQMDNLCRQVNQTDIQHKLIKYLAVNLGYTKQLIFYTK